MHIEGRRWFDRVNANTYFSVRIFDNGELIAFTPYEYGYGDQFLQRAIDHLKELGKVPADAPYGTRYIRETLHASYSVIDVQRKKEL